MSLNSPNRISRVADNYDQQDYSANGLRLPQIGSGSQRAVQQAQQQYGGS